MLKVLLRSLAALFVAAVLAVVALFAVYYIPDPGPGAPTVLVSIDRSLWNTVGLNRLSYVRQLRLAGVNSRIVRFPVGSAIDIASMYDDAQGLVLTGGGDVAASEYGGDARVVQDVKPARDAFELRLLELADERSLPVLGLCRGMQLLNVYRGGTLGDFRHDEQRFARHRNVMRGHDVLLVPNSHIAGIYGRTSLAAVTAWHGQHVANPGRGLNIVAQTADGTPEAIELRTDDRFIVGVQWHAEMPPWNNSQAALFNAFADAVRLESRASAKPSARRQAP